MLGVELGERFDVKWRDGVLSNDGYFSETGLHNCDGTLLTNTMMSILNGTAEIIKKALSDRLFESGLTCGYGAQTRAYYKRRRYEQELITLFCSGPADAAAAVGAFLTVIDECKDEMRQESWAYERNGELHIVQTGE